jgi:hypothetical protein
VHPGASNITILPVRLEAPPDLFEANGTRIRDGELPFMTIACGLAYLSDDIPEAFTPDEVPPNHGARMSDA